MSNFMTRRFTLRERILMIVLIVILLVGLYFFLVYYPVKNSLSEIQTEQEEIEMRLQIAETRKGIYDDMQKELNDIFSLPQDEITYMPKYDNERELMTKFDVIFEGVEPRLNINKTTNNGIVSRAISFSFEAPDFESAKRILGELTSTGFRCLMSSIVLSPINGDLENNSLSVSGTITFYEIIK